MAKTTQTFVTDDMDGSADAKEIKFSISGVDYTIDLAEKNAAKFEKALAPFVAKATKVGGRKKAPSAGDKKVELADVRAWARQNGYQISERGRVPRSVVAAYDAAN